MECLTAAHLLISRGSFNASRTLSDELGGLVRVREIVDKYLERDRDCTAPDLEVDKVTKV